MPLQDHFHAPLFPRNPWESFHVVWAGEILAYLNRLLPRRYLAVAHTHFGPQVEADVAETERLDVPREEQTNGPSEGGVALQTYAPPATALTMPAVFPDDLEVQVLDQDDDTRLVAVVELVSPRNKDRPAARRAFAAKVAAYLQRGIGVVTVDIVTSRQGNLHNQFVRLMDLAEPFLMASEDGLYAIAYRPARRSEQDQIDLWPASLSVGGALPILPLALRGAQPVPLDLETTYNEACQRSRL